MTGQSVSLWAPASTLVVSDALSDPAKIVARALQLRERERTQIAANFKAGSYEVAASFVWTRAMALLKKQLASLGMEFVGELLQRSDIDEFSDARKVVSDSEAISLARDLGMISSLQTIRLLHSQEVVSHFSGIDNDPSADQDEGMTKEEAVLCLRVCVQGILGHEQVSAAEDFKSFRRKLETETLKDESPEIIKLDGSPYFFIRTAVSIILSIFKSSKGAQIEHAARNAALIIPRYWPKLKKPERWQIGQAYAVEFSEGRKDSVKGLHSVLLAVKGFDYVPENLRSSTFIQVASRVVSTHQGMNNFYNEPAPMRELASLGTSIPGPALAACFTAVLCVKLGNRYGVSHAAQADADRLLSGLSEDRWIYYLNEKLENDRLILQKLQEHNPLQNWIELMKSEDVNQQLLTSRSVKQLLIASKAGESTRVKTIAEKLFAGA